MNSTACRREFEWAERSASRWYPSRSNPHRRRYRGRFVRRQIIDYSEAAERTAGRVELQGGLATLPPAPPLPEPLPEPPKAPLSYLTDIVDLITQANALDHDQQHRSFINWSLPLLFNRSAEERRGGLDILERFSSSPRPLCGRGPSDYTG